MSDFEYDAAPSRSLVSQMISNALTAFGNSIANIYATINNPTLTGTATLTGNLTVTAASGNAVTAVGPLVASGGFRAALNTITANTTLGLTGSGTTVRMYQMINATSGNITITLPSSSSNAGTTFVFKRIDNSLNTVTLMPMGGGTIDGVTSMMLMTQWSWITLVMTGTSNVWYVVN